jgi:flagellar protein FlbD
MDVVYGQEARTRLPLTPAAGSPSRRRGFPVIRLTRLNGSEVYLNADLVATVESHHDTVVTLVDGKTYVVLETAEQVVARITTYRAAVLAAVEMHIDDEIDEDGPAQVVHLHTVTERRG